VDALTASIVPYASGRPAAGPARGTAMRHGGDVWDHAQMAGEGDHGQQASACLRYGVHAPVR